MNHIPFGRGPSFWDEESVLEAFRRWEREHGKPPSSADWNRSGEYWPNDSRVRQMFGTWNAGMEAAGMPVRAKTPSSRTYSDEDILDAIRTAFREGDRTSDSFRTGRRRPYLAVITMRFGSWNQAVVAAGLELPRYNSVLWDPDQLRKLYWDKGLTMREIGERIGSDQSSVCHALHRAGIPTRRPGGSRGYRRTNWDPDQLRRWYCIEQLSLREIASKAECHQATVWRALRRFEIEARPPGSDARNRSM